MKTNAASKKFGKWMSIFFVCILLFCGCEPENGKTPSRMASGIYGGTDGISKAWFYYVFSTGDMVEQEGVAMNVFLPENNSVYLTNNGFGGLNVNYAPGVQEIQSNGITDSMGFVSACGKRSNWQTMPGITIYSSMAVNNPIGCGSGEFDFRTRAVIQPAIIAFVSANGVANQRPNNPIASSFCTEREHAALSQPTEDVPEFGIAVQPPNLVARKGNGGNGIFKEADYFIPINISKSDDYFKYSGPFCYSWIFSTPDAEPGIVGSEYIGKVSSAACQQGISVKVTIVSSGIDLKTHVARTEYFLPIDSSLAISQTAQVDVYDRWTPFPDPNIWDTEQYVRSVRDDWLDLIDPNLTDPNICPDPNVFFRPTDPNFYNFVNRLDTTSEQFNEVMIPSRVMQIKILPVQQDDEIKVEIDRQAIENIVNILPFWLSSSKMHDLDGNGIVNLQDLKGLSQ